MSKNISIIIVNYNGINHLKECFDSLYSSDAKDEELILVDNDSKDNSCQFVSENYPEVKIISLNENTGFAVANNIGVENASGKYIVFLNNDTSVSPNWLSPLTKILNENQDIGMVGSKLLLYHFPDRINSAGANLVINGTGYDIGLNAPDSEKYNIPGDKGAVCAACSMVRKDEFLKFGAFDKNYFMYFEDTDLCWRYWLLGKRVYYNPESLVYHKFGGTSGSLTNNAFRLFYGARNSNFNIIKNMNLFNAVLYFHVNLLYRLSQVLWYFFTLKFDCSFAIIRAYASFIKMFPLFYSKRKQLQSQRVLSDQDLFDRKLLVNLFEAANEILRLSKK